MDFSMIQIRDKEHQSLGIKELLQLCKDFPNDKDLGKHLRRLTRENSQTLLVELNEDDLKDWRVGTIWERTASDENGGSDESQLEDEYSRSFDEEAEAEWMNEGGMDYSGAFETDVEKPK